MIAPTEVPILRSFLGLKKSIFLPEIHRVRSPRIFSNTIPSGTVHMNVNQYLTKSNSFRVQNFCSHITTNPWILLLLQFLQIMAWNCNFKYFRMGIKMQLHTFSTITRSDWSYIQIEKEALEITFAITKSQNNITNELTKMYAFI